MNPMDTILSSLHHCSLPRSSISLSSLFAFLLFLLLSSPVSASVSAFSSSSVPDRGIYIVRMKGYALPVASQMHGELGLSSFSVHDFTQSLVSRQQKVLSTVGVKPLYKYVNSMNGFAAKLSDEQVTKLKGMPDVISINPERYYKPQTTFSPKYLGLDNPASAKTPGIYSKSNGSGIIIGVLDTGVWPNHPSFSDAGMPPAPKKFKGICQTGQNWTLSNCNRKIIGARYYEGLDGYYDEYYDDSDDEDYLSARDYDGHGTHTASTAAGSKVDNVTVGGQNLGQAHGIAYGAHLAIYKVCGLTSCPSSAILAALDDAITDGVDVISMSIGYDYPGLPLDNDLEIGLLNAGIAGIAMSLSAGNNGPSLGSVANVSPWCMSIGSNVMSRKFTSKVYLATGTNYAGYGVTNGTVPGGIKAPFIYSGDAAANSSSYYYAIECYPSSLKKEVVKGKVVLCDIGGTYWINQAIYLKSLGAVGLIIRSTSSQFSPIAYTYVLPTAWVSYSDGLKILEYANNTKNPKVSISRVAVSFNGAPSVSSFSSRGPNFLTTIMKPDIVAPGESIIAAFPPNAPTHTKGDYFNIISGTSMAAPHVAGALALLKSLHPNWPASALYSSLITTAVSLKNLNSNDFGGGLMQPNLAINPGLVYKAGMYDFTLYLCNFYSSATVANVTGKSCPKYTKAFHYNVPSLMMSGIKGVNGFSTFRRVMNVGPPNSTYSLEIVQPKGANVTISPTTLTFQKTGQEILFNIRVIGTAVTRNTNTGNFAFGSWTWISRDKKYTVKSPIMVNIVGSP